jgi:outer membrane protein assembly factor BamB/predicted phosphodiesterase
MIKASLTVALTFLLISLSAQNISNFQFALVTDTHVSGDNSVIDLRRTIRDINNNDSIAFVILSGDITEFGADSELKHAKQMLDSLNKPWHIIPGNHDTKWSESGGNSFIKIFGSETFSFVYGDFLFIGTNSGPNMRMSPGQIPREDIVWLDSLLMTPDGRNLKIIYVNHYPQDDSMNNWYEALDRLKKHNIQLILCGHGHTDKQYDFEGIPGLMCRSNLRGNKDVGGYNIIRISGDTVITASVRNPGEKTHSPWSRVKIVSHNFNESTSVLKRPDFDMNNASVSVKEVWKLQEISDIGAGGAIAGGNYIYSTTGGEIKAIRVSDGKPVWRFSTGAKIYSTPSISGNIIVESVTDGKVYALNASTGRLIWKFDAAEPIVASPVIYDDRVFIAGSGGKCYSLLLKNGKVKWNYNEVIGFVETIPVVHDKMIVFGTWENRLYALDKNTGELIWLWHNNVSNRMFSPAACVPAVANNRVFVVSPDRKMTCLDAVTGNVLWRSGLDGNNVRESMGVSSDQSMIYAKTMDGNVVGVSATAPDGTVIWRAGLNTGYDIAPGVIIESHGIVFIPTDKGFIYAAERTTGKELWVHRVSSCLINQIMPVDGHSVICSSMDGIIVKIDF